MRARHATRRQPAARRHVVHVAEHMQRVITTCAYSAAHVCAACVRARVFACVQRVRACVGSRTIAGVSTRACARLRARACACVYFFVSTKVMLGTICDRDRVRACVGACVRVVRVYLCVCGIRACVCVRVCITPYTRLCV
jgi:hypothetical protein